MRKIAVALTFTLLAGGCSDQSRPAPLPSVEWLVPYTTDADIPRHSETNLQLDRAEKLLGIGEDDRSILKRTEFETVEQFLARGPSTLATFSPPVDGRSRFVFSVPAHIQSYDLATKIATVCVFDRLIEQCLDESPRRDRVELSMSSIGLGGRAYTSYTFLKFTNPELTSSPVPLSVHIEPTVADSLDAAGDLKMAFVISFGPPYAEHAIASRTEASRSEQVTVNDIPARLERIVIYQTNGAVAGAVRF